VKESLVAIGTIGGLVVARLAWVYLKSRMEQWAREASERVLQEERHRHDADLATLNADLQKRIQEFGLYTKVQHRVYAKLYAKVREAADRYGRLADFNPVGDFTKYGPDDIRLWGHEHRILEAELKPILQECPDGPTKKSAELMAELDHRAQIRDAGNAYQEAKNIAALQALYCSDSVREQLTVVGQAMGKLEVEIQHPQPARAQITFNFSQEANVAVAELHRRMREELRRGDTK